MKKKVILGFAVAVLVGVVACDPVSSSTSNTTSSVKSSDSVSSDPFNYKVNEGVAAIFEEEFGYYNYSPSIIQLDASTRLVYYVSNETKNVSGDVLYFRKGTLQNNAYVYGERQVALRPSENGWDKIRVTSPDVIKGEFTYNTVKYSYLMAYSGNAIESGKQYQVGLAVSLLPEGPWIKVGTEPVVKYDPVVYGSTFGAGNPSLVSFNKLGQARLFVTYADEYLTGTRVYDLDLSNLNDIKGLEAHRYVSVQGLEEKDMGLLPMLHNADFATSSDGSQLFVVRDQNPLATINPTVATSIQIAQADTKILNEIEHDWTVLQTISDFETVDEEDLNSLGWPRIYSATIVTDAYGHIASTTEFSIGYSSSRVASSPTDTTYQFTPAIHIFEYKGTD